MQHLHRAHACAPAASTVKPVSMVQLPVTVIITLVSFLPSHSCPTGSPHPHEHGQPALQPIHMPCQPQQPLTEFQVTLLDVQHTCMYLHALFPCQLMTQVPQRIQPLTVLLQCCILSLSTFEQVTKPVGNYRPQPASSRMTEVSKVMIATLVLTLRSSASRVQGLRLNWHAQSLHAGIA